MKKRFFGKTLSVLLALVALVTSAVSASAANNSFAVSVVDTYHLDFYVAGCDGPTSKGITCKIGGTQGETEEVKLDSACNSEGKCTATLQGKTVGDITNISVKTNADNDLFLEKVEIKSEYTGETVTIYCGRWAYDTFFRTFKITDYVYKVSVKTAAETYAGTDLQATMCVNKEVGVELNDLSSANVLEEGKTDVFYLYGGASSVYNVQISLHLEWNAFDAVAGDWLLESVTFEPVQGEDAKTTSYTVNSWLGKDNYISVGAKSGTTDAYKVDVKTANDSLAGTDATLKLKIYGTEGETVYCSMNECADLYSDENNTNFEKGNLDSFKMTKFWTTEAGKNIGDIKQIKVVNCGGGFGADWKLDYITLTEMVADGESYKSYTFKLNDWIDGNTNLILPNPIVEIHNPNK